VGELKDKFTVNRLMEEQGDSTARQDKQTDELYMEIDAKKNT
jgi:hypothetical protein